MVEAIQRHRTSHGGDGNKLIALALRAALTTDGQCCMPVDVGLSRLSEEDHMGVLRVLSHHAGIIRAGGGAQSTMVRRCMPKAVLIGRAARAAASHSTGSAFRLHGVRSEGRGTLPHSRRTARQVAPQRKVSTEGSGTALEGSDRRQGSNHAGDSPLQTVTLERSIAAVEAKVVEIAPLHGGIATCELPERHGRRSARSLESILNADAAWARCKGSGSERAARLAKWSIGRAMDDGLAYVIQFRRLERWVERLAAAEQACPPVEGLASYLHRHTLPCAVGSSSNHYWLVRMARGTLWWRPMDADEIACTLEVPARHCVRRSIAAAAPGLGRELYGISVNVSSAAAVISCGMDGAAPPEGPLTVGVACAGAGVVCAAVDAALGGRKAWRYAFYVEREPRHAAVHDAAFASRRPMHFTHADAAEDIERMPGVYLWLCSPNCQPFTPDNQAPSTADITAALSEFGRIIRYVRLRRPTVAIVEEVAAVTHDSVRGTAGVTAQFEQTLTDVPGYYWRRIVECPSERPEAMSRRRRAWWIGQCRG